MKILSKVIIFIAAVFITLLCFNIFSVNKKIDTLDNHLEIVFEVTKRLNPSILGLIGGTLRGDPFAAVGGEERFHREIISVLFDWYAPLQFSPILGISKEIGRLVLRNNISDNFRL
jgi:hypothetical protein